MPDSPGPSSPIMVTFRFLPGLHRCPFAGARLAGSWTSDGHASNVQWSTTPMTPEVASNGTAAFRAVVAFPPDQVGATLSWGVQIERPDRTTAWAIAAEVPDLGRTDQVRTFTLTAPADGAQEETYALTGHGSYGAHLADGAVRFAVWAPNAQAVSVVFGGVSGYIADDGTGADTSLPPLSLVRDPDGVWP